MQKKIAALCFIVVLGISSAFCAGAEDQWVTFKGGQGAGSGKNIVLIAGDEEYRSEEGLPMMAKILATHHGFNCTVLFSLNGKGEIDPNAAGNIPGLEALDNADLMIILTRFRHLPDADMKHFDDFLKAGKPVIGLRTATHAFTGMKGEYEKYNNGYKGTEKEWRTTRRTSCGPPRATSPRKGRPGSTVSTKRGGSPCRPKAGERSRSCCPDLGQLIPNM